MKPLPEELKTRMQPQDGIPESSTSPHSGDPSDEITTEISLSEAKQLREEKLKTIQQAIHDGTYVSDALLEKALERMLQCWQERDDQSNSHDKEPLH